MITYGTIIQVITGFYLGCTGIVVQESTYVDDYVIDLTCILSTKETKEVKQVKLNKSQFKVINTEGK